MKKKVLAIPALLIAIGGGTVLAQSDLFAKAQNNPVISASEAKEIALKQLNGDVIDFEFDGEDRTPHYEIDIMKENEKIEVKINAKSGEVIVTEREVISTAKAENLSEVKQSVAQENKGEQPAITKEQAIKIAQSKAPGKVTETELDHDDNMYEIEIRNGKMEYDFEIDAKTGSIIKYEEDLDDDYDIAGLIK